MGSELNVNSYEIKINSGVVNVFDNELEAPVILFVHGNSLSSKTYSKQFNSFLNTKFRLIAFDLSGHGTSPIPDNPDVTYSAPGFAVQVSEMIEKLDLQSVTIVGHSYGGHIAVEAVPHCSKINGLLIFGSPLLSVPDDFPKGFLPNPLTKTFLTAEVTREAVEKTLQGCFLKTTNVPEEFINDFLSCDKQARGNLKKSLELGNLGDEISIAESLEIPLLILHGEDDDRVSLNWLMKLKLPTLWKGEIQIIPKGSHFPQWDHWTFFNQTLDEFVSSINNSE